MPTQHDWYDYLTLVLLFAGAAATFFLGLATLAVGGIAAYIAYRANRDAKAATDREQLRVELAERRNFANLANAYLRSIPNAWEALATGAPATNNKEQFIDLVELSNAFDPPNSTAFAVIARIQEYDKFVSAQPFDEPHKLAVAQDHTRIRVGITNWVRDPRAWDAADLIRRAQQG